MAVTMLCKAAAVLAVLLLTTSTAQLAEGRGLTAMNMGGMAMAPTMTPKMMAMAPMAAGMGMAPAPMMGMGMAPAPMMMMGPTYYAQPALPYSYGYLEPFIDARTVEIHWTKHTATYFKNLNEAIVPFTSLQSTSLANILMQLGSSAIPANISKTVQNNAGGAWNHLLYFKTMQAATAQTNMSMNSVVPQPLAGAIDASFGNYTAFRMKMTAAGLEVFGSGFAWLTVAKNGSLAVEATPNQDNPLSKGLGHSGNVPILGLDVWEHAYYLKHQNVRADYIKAWWAVVNWPVVNANYQAALQGNMANLTSYA